MVDYIPGLSQAKSYVQLCCGDIKGAVKTQDNFTKKCPGVSQLRSVVQYAYGNTEGAWDTFKAGLEVLNANPMTGVPKACLHFMVGDMAGAGEAVMASARTMLVWEGAALGAAFGGPPGAIAGAMAAGIAADTARSLAEAKQKEEESPHDEVDSAKRVKDKDNLSDTVWKFCDLAVGRVMDAKSGAETNNSNQNRKEAAKSGKRDQKDKTTIRKSSDSNSKYRREIVHNRKDNNAAPIYNANKGKTTTRKDYNSSSKCPCNLQVVYTKDRATAVLRCVRPKNKTHTLSNQLPALPPADSNELNKK